MFNNEYRQLLYDCVKNGVFDDLPKDNKDAYDEVVQKLHNKRLMDRVSTYGTISIILLMIKHYKSNYILLMELEEILKKEKDEGYEF